MAPSSPLPSLPPFDELRPRIVANLAAFPRQGALPLADGLRHAAVTVCVLEDEEGRPYTIVIRRAAHGRNAGQWALPGGRLDEGEDALAAALRELDEEASVRGVEVAGLLDDFVTDSGFVITPVVAFGGRQRPRRDPYEVASIHRVPLERFLAPGVPRWRIDEEGRSLLQMPLGPSIVIHAPTGAILWQFAEVALKGRDLRVAGVAQPHWTRR
ncbi:ADP-ribose pyrophosphatase YjhB, NUDIX family [Streptosporangium subroseum]|uniref:ADP-ribose pyrophosphatase YjhB, NUDIX family n=2 Tax=Streptosporangium TaxID=2000 RepID=A0A239NV64_9ACTN|nr:CoA pyrophosphatase [Streptosporangium subroseum]SNT58630.1 ADP-ribose pyrophosphatase YjhB, NUDIX family [Streptosporangium subroseum]